MREDNMNDRFHWEGEVYSLAVLDTASGHYEGGKLCVLEWPGHCLSMLSS